MCATDLNDRFNMTYVLEKMQEIAYPVVDEEENGAHSTMENLDEQVLPGLGFDVTVREFLDEFDEFSSEPGEPTRKAFTRLLQLHEMMKEAVPSPEPMVVNKYLSLLSRIMDAMDKRKSFSASVQATGSRYIDQTALTFSAEIERMFRLLNVHEGLRVDSAPAFEKSYFDKVQRMARPRIETSVAACDGSADSSETQTSDEERRELEAVEQHLDRQAGERRDQGNNRAPTLPRWFVPQFEVETGAFIAEGGFGSVYRGQWYGTEVVVKEIIHKKGDTPKKRAEFLREANTWFQLNHRNVVKMYGGCHVGRLVFVCEYASQGSLDSFSKADGRDPLLIWSTLLSAATGLRYLHDVGVVHGDLKGNNILIGKDGVAKLTDFGLSFFRNNSALEAEQGALGAYRWKAPECLNGGVATFASDIFSFGMCIIEAVSGALPWGNGLPDIAIKYHVTKGELPNRPAVFEDEEWDLVQQMCCLKPKQRLNIVSVVVRLTAIVKRRDANRRQLLQSAYKSDMLADIEQERMGAHTDGLDTLLQLVQSGVASRQNAAKYSMQTFSALTQGNDLTEQEVLQVVKLFHSDDTKQDWAAIALGYVDCPCSAIRADVTSWLVGLINERESNGLLKAEAVRAIGYLASDETSRTLIISHGAIPVLLEMMRADSDAEQAGAAWTLGCLAIGSEQNQVEISDAEAIDALVSLIRRGTYQQRIEGALALRRLTEGNTSIREIVIDTCWSAFVDIWGDATQRDSALMLGDIGTIGDEWKDRSTFSALVDLMLLGDDQQKNEAKTVLHARGHDRKHDLVKIPRDPVAILIAFVRVGTAEEKLESALVLRRLVSDNDVTRIAIVQKGGIAPLAALVRDGTDSQKVEASEVLSLLADGNDAIQNAIAREGGIAPLVALVQDGTDSQKDSAAGALGRLAHGTAAIRNAIAREGGIAALVAMVRDGTDYQREKATEVLRLLADGNDAIQNAIAREVDIAPLVALVQDGTDSQKEKATEVLRLLADGNDAIQNAIAREGGIAPLVGLVQDGTDSQKEKATEVLRLLVDGNDAIQNAIVREGGIAPLVGLVRYGRSYQREKATEVLRLLADGNDAIQNAIVREGGIAPLVRLVLYGTDSLKEKATEVLRLLADGNDAIQNAIAREVDIASLVALVRDVRYSQIGNVANVLRLLADGNDAIQKAIVREGGIAPLVALVRYGRYSYERSNAAEVLSLLAANNDTTRIAIAREG
ncbi:hypothetical protein BBJ28_00023722 [Nothophytophthora sp. Chile5]|nr:hypothetical protein BBJ28_00023722 [Nothophytophthora sp. Chile5]